MSRIEPGDYAVVISRDRSERGVRTGGYRPCQLAGCRGARIGIRWPNGKITWPCTKGLTPFSSSEWQIG